MCFELVQVHLGCLNALVTSITKRLTRCSFAGAEEFSPRSVAGPFYWLEISVFVAAITKGLVLRLATGTPEVALTRLDLDRDGRITSSFRICHDCFLHLNVPAANR